DVDLSFAAAAVSPQMLECLKGVHSCGYLHRDVKPANFVRRKKNGKEFVIIDF
ncbi:unnamed protein product, partial [Ectocarpus sp. 12 AP-2014]